MIPMTLSRDLVAHLATKHGATVVSQSDGIGAAVRALLDGAARISPVVDTIVDELLSRTARVSVTVPTPGVPLIVLSPAAVADPLRYAITGAHEMQHAVQIHAGGRVRTSIDYVASPELRARAEADAYAVGLWVGYLLTGLLPTLDDALASIAGDTYHLDADVVALARGVLESHLATMAGGMCPPITIAIDVLTWLRSARPDAVVPTVHP
jgi:hypothetical protein